MVEQITEVKIDRMFGFHFFSNVIIYFSKNGVCSLSDIRFYEVGTEILFFLFVVEQIDGMRKVYEIFNSTSVDPSVKKSAVDQLAIILQDHNLHAPFKAEGGVETVLKHLKLGLSRRDDVQVVQGFRYGSGFY